MHALTTKENTVKPVDMKVSAKQAMGDAIPPPRNSSKKMYPWGLEIRLDSVALDKLGIKGRLDAGAKCQIVGEGKITEVRMSATEDQKSRHVTIQITKLAIEHDGEEDAEKAMARGFKKTGRRRGY